jgi:glycosyltransferase involved in cell wall biosynthesis
MRLSAPGLHVLMTTDAVGGVWVFATSLAEQLCRRGHRVTLVTLGPPPSRDRVAALRHYPNLLVEPTDLALEWMDPEGTDFARARDVLSRIAEHLRPDLVHLNSYREAAFAWPAPTLLVAHSCVRSWWGSCRGGAEQGAQWERYAAHVSAGLDAADRWVAPTAWFRDQIQQCYAPRSRGEVIFNGTAAFSKSAVRRPVIMAAGRFWDEAKNLPALAAAAPYVQWPIHVAGSLQSPMEGRAVLNGPTWLGELPRPELLAQLGRSEMFVAPALYEPFGLTVLEAAAAGCALVLSDIPSFRELWQGAAEFVEPSNSARLADTLNALSRSTERRRGLQRAARQRAGEYGLDKTAEAYLQSYESLVRPRAVRPAEQAAVLGAQP